MNGAFGDCSAMVCVGDVDPAARFLVDSTKQCLDEAVQLVGPGAVRIPGLPLDHETQIQKPKVLDEHGMVHEFILIHHSDSTCSMATCVFIQNQLDQLGWKD